MYDEYILFCQERQIKPYLYRYIFTTHFNLGFGSPRSDTCSICDNLDVSTNDGLHKQRAERAFEVQKQDKKLAAELKLAYITFDLQQTLPLPKLSISKAFYLRQIWLYNFGIHLSYGTTSHVFFNIWSENEGGRGSTEIGSALLAFMENSNCSSKCKHLVAWSDSCSGQNKNFIIICLWQLLLLRGFESIDHKFPEPGHTFLDSDRNFARVEQAVRRHENIYSVDQYHQIMMNSARKPVVSVTRMADKFYELQSLPQKLGIRNVKRNTDGEKIPFRDGIRWIRTVKFGEYTYKCSLTGEEQWKTVRLTTSSSDPDTDLTDMLRPAGVTKQINIKKLADVRKQICYIPSTYKQFYLSLVSTQNNDNDQVTEDTGTEEDDCSEPSETTSQPQSTRKQREDDSEEPRTSTSQLGSKRTWTDDSTAPRTSTSQAQNRRKHGEDDSREPRASTSQAPSTRKRRGDSGEPRTSTYQVGRKRKSTDDSTAPRTSTFQAQNRRKRGEDDSGEPTASTSQAPEKADRI